MLDEIKNNLNAAMEKALKSLNHNLTKIRTGRANPSILDGLMVDYYGSPTAIKQVGQISTPEARLLQIQPFDKSAIPAIEKAIMAANLGVTPTNDGNFVRIPFPSLTEDKRKEFVKDVKKMSEEARVALRNARRDQNEVVKKAEKDKKISEDESKKLQEEVQKITDKLIKQIDEISDKKEKELMTV